MESFKSFASVSSMRHERSLSGSFVESSMFLFELLLGVLLNLFVTIFVRLAFRFDVELFEG